MSKVEVVTKSKTYLEKVADDNDRSIAVFRYLRPYLIKLLTHMIFFFLCIRAYTSFLNSSTVYEIFKKSLNQDVIIDTKLIDYTQKCETGYEDISFTYFPVVNEGCRCDMQILPSDICGKINSTFSSNENAKSALLKCSQLDKNITRTKTLQYKRSLFAGINIFLIYNKL